VTSRTRSCDVTIRFILFHFFFKLSFALFSSTCSCRHIVIATYGVREKESISLDLPVIVWYRVISVSG